MTAAAVLRVFHVNNNTVYYYCYAYYITYKIHFLSAVASRFDRNCLTGASQRIELLLHALQLREEGEELLVAELHTQLVRHRAGHQAPY